MWNINCPVSAVILGLFTAAVSYTLTCKCKIIWTHLWDKPNILCLVEFPVPIASLYNQCYREWEFILKLLLINDGFPFSGAARGHSAVEWAITVLELCGLVTQKKGSRSTPGTWSIIRSITSSPSCLRSVLADGHASIASPSFDSFKPATHFSGWLHQRHVSNSQYNIIQSIYKHIVFPIILCC